MLHRKIIAVQASGFHQMMNYFRALGAASRVISAQETPQARAGLAKRRDFA